MSKEKVEERAPLADDKVGVGEGVGGRKGKPH